VDLVITDLVMPGMGGRELIERIRQQGPDMPVMPPAAM
jgi:CheY-like chemotaxis protein